MYDNAGRVLSTTSGGKTLAYQYDPAGNRTRIAWPEGGFYVTYGYDALNRSVNIRENGTVNLVTGYGYDDLSRSTTVSGVDEPVAVYEGSGTTCKNWLYPTISAR